MRKPIVILGGGESGTGAAMLAQQLGFPVFLSDSQLVGEAHRQRLTALGIPFEEGQHTLKTILSGREVIKSPGIPETAPVMSAVREKGIPVCGEIEFAARHAGKCRIIAITGTNGKTTTATLVHHILQQGGLPVRLGGNVGTSFAGMVADDLRQGQTSRQERIFVLEISSFQLDDTRKFRPHISALLNITPDHLDRYGYQMENYVRSKFRIVRNQKRGDLFITHAEDAHIQGFLRVNPGVVPCRMETISRSDLTEGYVRVGLKWRLDLSNTALNGEHNRFNAACAARIALRMGMDAIDIGKALFSFCLPPHRMEKIGTGKGVLFINDSKATNTDAAHFALEAMDRPVIWIAGGTDKGNDYSQLVPVVRKRVKAIVCLGLDNASIRAAFGGLNIPIVETNSAGAAVLASAELSTEGDVVLLSPACASFDLFRNYEHRGDLFRQAVQEFIKTQQP